MPIAQAVADVLNKRQQVREALEMLIVAATKARTVKYAILIIQVNIELELARHQG